METTRAKFSTDQFNPCNPVLQWRQVVINSAETAAGFDYKLRWHVGIVQAHKTNRVDDTIRESDS